MAETDEERAERVEKWRAARISSPYPSAFPFTGPDRERACSGCGLPLGAGPIIASGWTNPFALPDGPWYHDDPDCVPAHPLPVVKAGRGAISFFKPESLRG